MMKRKNLLFRGLLAVAAVPMLMASCNSDEPRPEINQYVTIGRVGVGEMETRAGYDATNNFLPTSSTDSLTLFVKSSLSDPKYSRDYLQFTCDGSKWSTKTPLAWGGNTAKWSAFYGTTYQDVFYNSSTEKYNLQFKNIEDPHRDILYAYGTTSSGNIGINFKHLKAKLRYNFYVVSGNDPLPYMNGINTARQYSQSELNVGEDFTIDPEEGVYSLNFKFIDYPELKVTPAEGANYSYEYLVVPGSTYEDYLGESRVIAIDAPTNYIGTTSFCIPGQLIIESNKIYVFDIYIADNDVIKVNATIKAWEDEEFATKLETE
ncbi:MAG: fimbrillin family protein [Bacteroidales bacterium]|nr:fimbrillin family protein [Bacteroidales bacterium]